MLGPVDIGTPEWKLDWVVIGAESGKNRRPMELFWALNLVDECRAKGIPVFVKQLHIEGKLVSDIEQFPPDLRVRELPALLKEPRE